MIILSGADVLLAKGVCSIGTVIIDGDRIADVVAGVHGTSAGAGFLDATHHLIVPGFVDVHVHGVEGFDALGGPDAIGQIARRLPQYGVTAFCPTTVACS